MQQLTQEDPTHALELVTEIVSKVSGVFLWVMLIVRSLLTGLRNHDDVSILQRRLRYLAADLSSLYTHMLNHVEPLYNEQASMAFQIYDAISKEKGTADSDAFTALELDLAITATWDSVKSSPLVRMTNGEVYEKCEHLDTFLKTRCAGLLEIHHGQETRTSVSYHLPKPQNIRYFDALKPTQKVNYLHRTVKDFLHTEEVRTKLLNDIKSAFIPTLG
jgi:hypothetical protein